MRSVTHIATEDEQPALRSGPNAQKALLRRHQAGVARGLVKINQTHAKILALEANVKRLLNPLEVPHDAVAPVPLVRVELVQPRAARSASKSKLCCCGLFGGSAQEDVDLGQDYRYKRLAG